MAARVVVAVAFNGSGTGMAFGRDPSQADRQNNYDANDGDGNQQDALRMTLRTFGNGIAIAHRQIVVRVGPLQVTAIRIRP